MSFLKSSFCFSDLVVLFASMGSNLKEKIEAMVGTNGNATNAM